MPQRDHNGLAARLWILLLLAALPVATSTSSTSSPNSTNNLLVSVLGNQWVAAKPLPFHVTVVENPEENQIGVVTNQTQKLFQTKDYDGLEALVRKLRDSKEQFGGGTWKFYGVYIGLALPQSASEAEWKAHLAALQAWIDARPNSITARVALADALTTYAWKARGNDWASAVTDEGWQLFHQRLIEAVKVLDDAKGLKDKCPYWWSVLLRADLGLGPPRSQYDATFDEAIHAWPGYTAFYSRRARHLLPRWYGQEGEWESDLEKSASKIGGEDGDLLYARTVAYMHEANLYDNIFKETAVSWPRVNRGFEIMEKRFPNSVFAPSEHAYLAVLSGDQRTARKYFDQLAGKVDLCTWHSVADFASTAQWVYSN